MVNSKQTEPEVTKKTEDRLLQKKVQQQRDLLLLILAEQILDPASIKLNCGDFVADVVKNNALHTYKFKTKYP